MCENKSFENIIGTFNIKKFIFEKIIFNYLTQDIVKVYRFFKNDGLFILLNILVIKNYYKNNFSALKTIPNKVHFSFMSEELKNYLLI